jgi:hypothetical protein
MDEEQENMVLELFPDYPSVGLPVDLHPLRQRRASLRLIVLRSAAQSAGPEPHRCLAVSLS